MIRLSTNRYLRLRWDSVFLYWEKHCVPKTIEPIMMRNSICICVFHRLISHSCSDKHKECRSWKMKVRHKCINNTSMKSWIDKYSGLYCYMRFCNTAINNILCCLLRRDRGSMFVPSLLYRIINIDTVCCYLPYIRQRFQKSRNCRPYSNNTFPCNRILCNASEQRRRNNHRFCVNMIITNIIGIYWLEGP